MTQSAPTAKRQPKGWDKLVSQLNEVTDRRQFLRNMLDVQCKVVSAEYGGLWVQGDDGQPKLIEAWPDQLTKAREGSAVINLMSEAAKSGLDKGVSHVLKLEPHTTGPEADINAHVFVTPLRAGGQVAAVCTTVAETPDENAVQHTAALRELAAGLYEGFEAKQQTQQFRSDAERVRKSLAALGVVQEAAGFHGACLNL